MNGDGTVAVGVELGKELVELLELSLFFMGHAYVDVAARAARLVHYYYLLYCL